MSVEVIDVLKIKAGANNRVADGEDVRGAFVTVADTTARDAIPTAVLRNGMLVRIGTTGNIYEWGGSSWSLTTIFGGAGHVIKDEGTPVTPRQYLNFVGVNVAVTDDGTNTVVTVGQVSLTAGVTGVLPVANGGTGLSAGGTNGQVLTMVSGAPAWSSPSGGALTAPASPGDNGKVAIAASGNLSYALLADANVDSAAALALSKLANGSACSVVGRSANSSGAHADIASSADGEVFRRAGGALGWGTIATAGIGDSQVTLAKLANGSSLSVVGRATNSSGVYADIQATNDAEVLMRSGTSLGFAKIADANVATGANLAWSKFASAIGNLGFTGLKSLTYNSEVTTTGATPAVDFTTGDCQLTNLNANCTPTFTAPAGIGRVQWRVVNDATGRTITFPGSVVGSPPQPTTGSGVSTTYRFFWNGTNYLYDSASGLPAGASAGKWLIADASGTPGWSDVALTAKTISYSAADATAAALVLRKSRGTSASPAAHNSGDALANFVAQGHDGSAFYEAGAIQFVAEAAGGTSKAARAESWLHDGVAEVRTGNLIRRKATTTNATLTTVYSVSINNDEIVKLNIVIAGKQQSSANRAYREIIATVRRPGSGSVIDVAHQDVVPLFKSDITWGLDTEITYAINNSTFAVDVTVKGVASTNIDWSVEVSWSVF